MIENIFQELKDCKDANQCLLILTRIDRVEMFEDVMEKYDNWWPVIKWIICCFSFESDLLELGNDWDENKRKVAELCEVKTNDDKDDMYLDNIVNLKDEPIWRTVEAYLNYQGSREFKHLIVLRQLYERMLSSTFDDNVDYDQQYKNSVYAKKLWDDIGEYEQAVRQKFGNGFMGVKAKARKVVEERKTASGLSIEEFAS